MRAGSKKELKGDPLDPVMGGTDAAEDADMLVAVGAAGAAVEASSCASVAVCRKTVRAIAARAEAANREARDEGTVLRRLDIKGLLARGRFARGLSGGRKQLQFRAGVLPCQRLGNDSTHGCGSGPHRSTNTRRRPQTRAPRGLTPRAPCASTQAGLAFPPTPLRPR